MPPIASLVLPRDGDPARRPSKPPPPRSWWKYVGLKGAMLGMDRFGASGKATDLFPHFGFTADNVAKQVERLLK